MESAEVGREFAAADRQDMREMSSPDVEKWYGFRVPADQFRY